MGRCGETGEFARGKGSWIRSRWDMCGIELFFREFARWVSLEHFGKKVYFALQSKIESMRL